jgi:2-polyprenyl-3-methyl-5-hydroxy-6-metoxy-1,4-benzoquinol methylase
MQQVREDFDRIALLTEHEGNVNETYSNQLLSHIPKDCDHVLEVGCGFGAFSRLVAHRARCVTGIDLSSQMINVAKGRSANYSNLEFVLDDFLQANFQAESFDCIVTIATLHHLPLDETLVRIKSLLRPGGVLVLHDLLAAGSHIDRAFDVVRLPLSMALQFWRTGRFRARRDVRRAWIEHGKGESYLTPQEVRAMRDEHLPGGRIFRHLLWRYTVVWTKPAQP